MDISIPVSIGELWDKYSILLIKKNKINDCEKLKYLNIEISLLDNFMNKYPYNNNELFLNLKLVNDSLWNIEDKLRIKELNKSFDDEFIQLARSVYYTNDKRADIKKQINILFMSNIHEVKNYVKYI
jgi:hypothetical protein